MFVVRRVLVLFSVLLLAALAAAGAASAGEPAPTSTAPVQRAAVSVPAKPALRSQTPCAATARACVDLSSRRAWLTDGKGHITFGPIKARGGMKSAPTPVGSFSVSRKVKNYHSREFDAPMPYSVFFEPGIALHQGSTAKASNGCVHLTWTSARTFFSSLQPGDTVQVVS